MEEGGGGGGGGIVGQETSALVDFGGIASLLAGHPFDTIKTRLQAQSQAPSSSATSPHQQFRTQSSTLSSPLISTASVARYTSSIDALRRIIAEEKFVGLYKGVTSPMLGVAVMNASIFGVYGLALRNLQGEGEQQARLQDIFLAGCASGIVSA
jgi:solute carrier family 25 carnitine/acylcarnitine transporter 20/29